MSTIVLGYERVDGVQFRIMGRVPDAALPPRLRKRTSVWGYSPDDQVHVLFDWRDERVAAPRTGGFKGDERAINARTLKAVEAAIARIGGCPVCGAIGVESCLGSRGQVITFRHGGRQ